MHTNLGIEFQAVGSGGVMAARKRAMGRGGPRPGSGRRRIVKDPVRLSVDYERTDCETLEEIADERGVSVANVIRTAVRAYLKRLGRR